MDEGEDALKAVSHHLRAEGLASMSGIDHQRRAGKVFFFIFFGRGPGFGLLYLFRSIFGYWS